LITQSINQSINRLITDQSIDFGFSIKKGTRDTRVAKEKKRSNKAHLHNWFLVVVAGCLGAVV